MSNASCVRPSLAELKEALRVAAYVVLRHGDVYVPIMDRLAREVDEACRDTPSSSERARRILAAPPSDAAAAMHTRFLENAKPAAPFGAAGGKLKPKGGVRTMAARRTS